MGCSHHGRSYESSLRQQVTVTMGMEYVRDYIILHELMHLREHNHSRRFWKQVETVCPDYSVAEKWLKQHRQLLG
jgi:predicted metal-dependent hydrolase